MTEVARTVGMAAALIFWLLMIEVIAYHYSPRFRAWVQWRKARPDWSHYYPDYQRFRGDLTLWKMNRR